jgi:hypothetical protein
MPEVPKFADLGKKVKDLFKKQYDYKSTLKLTTKGSPLSVETDVSTPIGDTNAQCKVTYKNKEYGSVETVVSNDPKKFSTEITLSKLFSGLELKCKPFHKSASRAT